MKKIKVSKFSMWIGLGVSFLASYLFSLTNVWQLVLLAGIVGGVWSQKALKSVFSGSVGVLLGWGLSIGILSLQQHTNLLVNQIAGLILGSESYGFLLILGVLLIGGILGALGGVIGHSIRILVYQKQK